MRRFWGSRVVRQHPPRTTKHERSRAAFGLRRMPPAPYTDLLPAQQRGRKKATRGKAGEGRGEGAGGRGECPAGGGTPSPPVTGFVPLPGLCPPSNRWAIFFRPAGLAQMRARCRYAAAFDLRGTVARSKAAAYAALQTDRK